MNLEYFFTEFGKKFNGFHRALCEQYQESEVSYSVPPIFVYISTALWKDNGHVHTVAKFGCQFTYYSLIAFCTHTIHWNTGVTTALTPKNTTAFTEILRSVYGTELNN